MHLSLKEVQTAAIRHSSSGGSFSRMVSNTRSGKSKRDKASSEDIVVSTESVDDDGEEEEVSSSECVTPKKLLLVMG